MLQKCFYTDISSALHEDLLTAMHRNA